MTELALMETVVNTWKKLNEMKMKKRAMFAVTENVVNTWLRWDDTLLAWDESEEVK